MFVFLIVYSVMNLITQISIVDKPVISFTRWTNLQHIDQCVCLCEALQGFFLCLLEGATMMEAFTCWPTGINHDPHHRSRISPFG